MSINAKIISLDNFKMGELVDVNVVIENKLKEVCKIINPNLSQNSVQLSRNAFLVKFNEDEIVYEGIALLNQLNFIEIQPGASLNFDASIAKEYLLNKIGKYSIEFNGYCQQGNREFKISSETKVISLNAGNSNTPVQVRSMDSKIQSYTDETMSFKTKSGVNYINASPDQEKATEQAHQTALKALKLIATTANNKNYWLFGDYTYLSMNDKNYKDMFCIKHSNGRETLLDGYTKINDYLSSGNKIEYIFKDGTCYKKIKTALLFLIQVAIKYLYKVFTVLYIKQIWIKKYIFATNMISLKSFLMQLNNMTPRWAL